ncbi:TRAP transporter small permease [Thalassotalea agariperforans]
MQFIISTIDNLIKSLLALFMLLVIAVVSWQVFSRHVLADPSSGSGEISRFLLIWIGMLGAAYCYRMKSHLSLNILTEKMNAKPKWITEIFIHCMVLIFASVVMAVGGINLMLMTFDPVQLSPVLEVKMGYIYSVVPLSGIFMSIYAINEIAQLIKAGKVVEQKHDEVNV